MATVQTPIAEGDRVAFYTNRRRNRATGTVEGIWAEGRELVASVLVDDDPFVLAGSHIVDVADLKRIRGAR